jgi:hypothetical protein
MVLPLLVNDTDRSFQPLAVTLKCDIARPHTQAKRCITYKLLALLLRPWSFESEFETVDAADVLLAVIGIGNGL